MTMGETPTPSGAKCNSWSSGDHSIKEMRYRTMSNFQGTITGKGDGKWGRVTINRDGSLLLENVTISGVVFENCDIHGESGEYPIPFADRMNQLCDYLATRGEYRLYVSGRTDEQYQKDQGNG